MPKTRGRANSVSPTRTKSPPISPSSSPARRTSARGKLRAAATAAAEVATRTLKGKRPLTKKSARKQRASVSKKEGSAIPRPPSDDEDTDTDNEMVEMISEEDFFKHLFGFVETPDAAAQLDVTMAEDGSVTLSSRVSNARYACGRFEAPTIAELSSRASAATVAASTERRPGTFSIRAGAGPRSLHLHRVDVGAIQADPDNNGATFQVASNFNCLEFISNHDRASRGVGKYVWDRTQGPAASVSAAPATVYRNYLLPHQPLRSQAVIGQLQTQVNLLERLPIPVVNGYVHFSSEEVFQNLVDDEFDFEDFSDVRVGLHTEVQVTSGLRDRGVMHLCLLPDQRVTQVFTAAVNMADVPKDLVAHRLFPLVPCMLLRAAYRGTILAALSNALRLEQESPARPGRNKLFLTLIGGGVFGNDFSWILDAIEENEQLLLSSGLDTTLVMFNHAEVPAPCRQRLAALVKRTGGSIESVQ